MPRPRDLAELVLHARRVLLGGDGRSRSTIRSRSCSRSVGTREVDGAQGVSFPNGAGEPPLRLVRADPVEATTLSRPVVPDDDLHVTARQTEGVGEEAHDGAFARPPSGGAATRTFHASPWRPTTPARSPGRDSGRCAQVETARRRAGRTPLMAHTGASSSSSQRRHAVLEARRRPRTRRVSSAPRPRRRSVLGVLGRAPARLRASDAIADGGLPTSLRAPTARSASTRRSLEREQPLTASRECAPLLHRSRGPRRGPPRRSAPPRASPGPSLRGGLLGGDERRSQELLAAPSGRRAAPRAPRPCRRGRPLAPDGLEAVGDVRDLLDAAAAPVAGPPRGSLDVPEFNGCVAHVSPLLVEAGRATR